MNLVSFKVHFKKVRIFVKWYKKYIFNPLAKFNYVYHVVEIKTTSSSIISIQNSYSLIDI